MCFARTTSPQGLTRHEARILMATGGCPCIANLRGCKQSKPCGPCRGDFGPFASGFAPALRKRSFFKGHMLPSSELINQRGFVTKIGNQCAPLFSNACAQFVLLLVKSVVRGELQRHGLIPARRWQTCTQNAVRSVSAALKKIKKAAPRPQ